MTRDLITKWLLKNKVIMIQTSGIIIILIVVMIVVFGAKSHPSVSQNESKDVTPSSSIAPASSISSLSSVCSIAVSSSNSASQTTPDPIPNIIDVDFISSNIGYLCLAISTNVNNPFAPPSCKLLKTIDGGNHWATIGNNNQLSSVSFVDTKIGYGLLYVGYGQMHEPIYSLVKTIDGGINWNPIDFMEDKTSTTNGIISVINVVNKDVMFIGRMDGNIYKTVDGCKNWTQINMPRDDAEDLSMPLNMCWVSSNEGYVLYNLSADQDAKTGSSPETLYYTNNSGETWSMKSKVGNPTENPKGGSGLSPFVGTCVESKFFSNGVGYIGFTEGALLKTTDYGVHFSSEMNSADFNPLPDFINNNEGFGIFQKCVNSDYMLYEDTLKHTIDGGKTWTEILSPNVIKSLFKK